MLWMSADGSPRISVQGAKTAERLLEVIDIGPGPARVRRAETAPLSPLHLRKP